MSERRDRETGLDPGDADLVRRIAESYRPAERGASARVSFRAGVDARVRRRSIGRRLTTIATAATAAAAIAIAWSIGPWATDPSAPYDESDEALLAFALPSAAESDEESLPADYQAIEDLFLESDGEGV